MKRRVVLLISIYFNDKINGMKKLILASQSPRRREIMKFVDLDFDVIPSDCDENIEYSSPADMVSKLSFLKANDIAKKIKKEDSEGEYLVIGSDTTVYFEGEILGKPKNEEDAFNMLKRMSGKTHIVYTGVTVIDTFSNKTETFFEETKVTFWDVTDEEIKEYIATGDPMDKAGAYGVQGRGAFIVKKVEGDYFTVVGLPIAHLLQVLKKFN